MTTINGTAGDDDLAGTAGDDIVNGRRGTDRLDDGDSPGTAWGSNVLKILGTGP